MPLPEVFVDQTDSCKLFTNRGTAALRGDSQRGTTELHLAIPAFEDHGISPTAFQVFSEKHQKV